MFGGGGMNPRKMKQMMKQMGIDLDELDADEVVIRTGDTELVFEDAEVTVMDAQGQRTYQVVGEPEERARSGGDAGDAGDSGEASAVEDAGDAAGAIPESDVSIVAQRAGVSEDAAREALEAEDGDLAAAIARFE